MSTINDMSSKMFAQECNDIYVAATDDVVVRIQIVTADNVTQYDQASIYTPVKGKIEFGNLAELVNKCILLTDDLQQLTGISQRSNYATLTVSIPSETLSQNATVYYCTAFNASDPATFSLFPTQNRKRKILADQVNSPVWVPHLASGDVSVTVKGTYVHNGTQLTARNTTTISQYADRYILMDCAPAAVATLLQLPSGAVLYKYEVMLLTSGNVADVIEFEVDRRHYPQRSEMMFLNMFGLPESVVLRGRQEETHELEATYGYSGWNMVRLEDDVHRDFRTNTGWLTKAERRQYGELYRSPLTARQDSSALRRIIIRDIAVVFTTPTNEPQSFDVTWRYADKRFDWTADIEAAISGHNIFDNTFSIAFD